MQRTLGFLNWAVVFGLSLFGVYLGLYPREPQHDAMPSLGIVLILAAGVLALLRIVPMLIGHFWPSVEFFPSRSALITAHGSIAQRLKNIERADAIWVLGQKFYHAAEDTHKIKRLLLPNPDSKTLKFLTQTTQNWTEEEALKDITGLAKAAGAEVRWYDHFISHSIILADTNKWRGWVHIESVFPYSTNERRPSYTIYRRSHRRSVEEMQRVFNELWEASILK
jgi:hypothetical protein